MEVEDHRKNKVEERQIREDDDRLKVIDTCEDFVRMVLAFSMDHISNIKVKELRVLLRYHFGHPFKFSDPK